MLSATAELLSVTAGIGSRASRVAAGAMVMFGVVDRA